LIRYFDQPERCAWHLLSDKESKILHDEIGRCADPDSGYPYIARNYYWITSKDIAGGGDTLLRFKETQEMVWETIRWLRIRNRTASRGVKVLIIKGRQLYVSYFCEGLMAYETQFNPNNRGLLVSYSEAHAGKLFGVILHIYDQLPWWLRPMIGSRKYEEGIHLINPDSELRRLEPGLNSRITVQGANQSVGVAEGETVNTAHICLAPHTLIQTANGVPKPIVDVREGDTVITSRGTIERVKKVWKSPRTNELSTELWVWGEFAPLSVTRDHKILCPEGLREAKDIEAGDYVCRPVRPITETQKTREFIEYAVGRVPAKRRQTARGIEMDFDWGWVCGMYLAEGSVKRGPAATGYTEVTFGIDRDEEDVVRAGLVKVIGSDRHIGNYRSKNSRTSVLRVSWAGFARFIEQGFGHTDTKHVPDWAWDAGRDFCRGIVAGYLQGDGHIAPGLNVITASSVRPAITIQMRDLAASLGYGWSSIHFRQAGVFYNRNCRAQWSWHLISETAKRCKEDLGWADTAENPPMEPTHWAYSEDRKFVYAQVESNQVGFSESFYDLEVDAPEHDFCTVQCCVKNSEFGSYDPNKARKIIMGDFRWALPDAPGTTAILETRVQKASKFAERLWEAMVELGDDADWYPLFIPIYFDKSHFIAPQNGWQPEAPELAVKERAAEEWCACDQCGQIRPVNFGGESMAGIPCRECKEGTYAPYVLQDGQMRWLQLTRKNAEKMGENAVMEMQQSLATNPQEAFASVTETVFSKQARDWVAQTTRGECLARGYMASDGTFHAPRRQYGEESAICWAHGCKQNHTGEGDRYLKIWQPPMSGCKYGMSVDPSGGLGGGRDYAVILIFKLGRLPQLDIQVAQYRCNTISPWHLADLVNALGRWYNNALAVVDYTNQQTTGDRLLNYFRYPNIYQWVNPDAVKQNSNRWHWVWNNKNKEAGWAVLDGWLRDHSFIVKDPVLAKELRHFQRMPDGSLGAPDSKDDDGLGDDFEKVHDDCVMAAIQLVIACHQQDPHRSADFGVPQSDGLRGPGEWKGTCSKCGKDFDAQAPCERDRCPYCGSIWLKWRMPKMEGKPGVGPNAILGFKWDDMMSPPGAARDRYGASDEFSFGTGDLKGFYGQE
jgi:DNA-directed RNA polymerase subunit RPC12/RpoP